MANSWTPVMLLAFLLPPLACHKRTPPEHEYPQGWVTEDYPAEEAKSLAGVVDPSDFPLEPVLVERMTRDYKTRVDATLTDERGRFHFRIGPGTYHLRFRFRGFDDYELP